jgi:photosystem II stability/assembly factor-like uncharacterized protein
MNRLQRSMSLLVMALLVFVAVRMVSADWEHVAFDSTYGVPSIVFRTADSETAYAAVAAEDSHGIYRSIDNGQHWNLVYSIFDAIDLDVDPLNRNTVFFITQQKAYKSTDGGDTWQRKSQGLSLHAGDQYLTDIAINPCHPETAYISVADFGACGFMYFTANGGAQWDTAGMPAYGLVEMDPVRCGWMYTDKDGFNSCLIRSVNSGSTWDSLLTIIIDDVSINPLNPDVIYVACSDLYEPGIYRTLDGGDTWTRFAEESGLAQPRVRVVTVNPVNPAVVYTGGNGVYRSTDGGATWAAFNEGLPGTTGVRTIAVDSEHGETILLGTNKYGIYRRTELLTRVGPRPKEPVTLGVTATPNPFRRETAISYLLPVDAHTTIDVYDVSGRLMRTLIASREPAGTHAVTWNGRDAYGRMGAPGIYFARIQSSGMQAVKPVVFIK